jgi:hypothetical protein
MSSSARRAIRYFVAAFLTTFLTNMLIAQGTPSVPANVIPQGTLALIQLSDRLDTQTAKASDHFRARLAEPLTAENGMTIDVGKKVRGHISAVEPGLQRRLLLSFDEIETSRGWVPLMATVTGVPGEHGLRQIGDEGEIGRKGMTKEQIAEAVVVSAGEAAEQGMHEGGKKAAAVAAGSGAVDGAISAFASQHDLVLEKGTALEIRLDRNLGIPAR